MGLEVTGARTVPGVAHENYWFRRHEIVYRDAARRCAGLDVLDAGAGEGYGTAILAETTRSVVGVELDREVCAHAHATYRSVPFVQADLCDLPLAAGSVDAVVSLQVIEHLWDVAGALDEAARVLRPGGLLVCATPNRLTFSPGSDTPLSPFHTVEFAPDELVRLLARWFAEVELLGVFHGPRLAAVEALRGAPLPELCLASPPDEWPPWLAELVASVTVEDFALRADAPPAASLDLLAVARAGDRAS